tara:strand:+ start:1914 stop:2597 length:684 start_codon:yes stop_codon:yes gene_type:complete
MLNTEIIPTDMETKYVYTFYKNNFDNFSDTRKNIWPCVQNYIDKQLDNSNIFEIGCGNGKNMMYAKNKGHQVTGIDRCSEFVNLCVEKGLNNTYTDCCLRQSFIDDQFDCVLSIAVFHHLSTDEHRIKALDNMINVIKPGGTGFLTVWAVEQPDNTKKKFTIGDNIVKWNRPYDDENNIRKYKVFNRYYYVYTKQMFMDYLNNFTDRIEIINIFNEYGNWICEFAKK